MKSRHTLNLPNRLTVLRILLIPLFMAVLLLPPIPRPLARVGGAAIFALTSLTDMLDGRIARKRGLVTDFGKFLDPVADKLMVISSLVGILFFERSDTVFAALLSAAAVIVVARELGITGLRLAVVGRTGEVVAANLPGKVKTVSQIAFVLAALLEPMLWEALGFAPTFRPLTYLLMAVMSAMTVVSGVLYLLAYLPFITEGDI